MKNLSRTSQNFEYCQVMKKRIQYYAEKYDPYKQYISSIDQLPMEVNVKEKRERRLALIQSFFSSIF